MRSNISKSQTKFAQIINEWKETIEEFLCNSFKLVIQERIVILENEAGNRVKNFQDDSWEKNVEQTGKKNKVNLCIKKFSLISLILITISLSKNSHLSTKIFSLKLKKLLISNMVKMMNIKA